MGRPDDAELEAALRTLARHLDVPPAPAGLSGRVRARLEAAPPRRERLSRPAAAALAALVAALLLAGMPPVRAAVERILDFAGISISSAEAPSPPPGAVPPGPVPPWTIAPTPPPTGPPTGPPEPPVASAERRPVSLPDAKRTAGFPVSQPSDRRGPDQVYLLGSRPPHVVQLGWRDATAEGGQLILDQCLCTVQPEAIAKLGVRLEPVPTRVRGAEARWIPGPHTVIYRDPAAGDAVSTGRMAGSTLIWQSGRVTYRLEGAPDLDTARRIAGSIAPSE